MQPEVKTTGRFQRFVSRVLTAALILLPAGPALTPMKAFAAPTLALQKEEPLTAGATLKSYVYQNERKGQAVTTDVKVIQVDLQNPYVKLDVMTGTGGQFTKKQSVLGMAKETQAVAGVNGDFFNTKAEGVPIGPEIQDSKLMATPPYLPGYYSFGITKDRKPVIDLFTFQGKITAKDGASYDLGGVNKTYYWFEPSGQHSMIDGLFMYTNAWGQEDRSNDGVTSPTEVLVVNNVVTQIVQDDILHMVAPKNGYILRSSGKAAEFVVGHLKVGDTIKADYSILAQDPALNYTDKDFQMMIGGHTILVSEGQPAEFSRKISEISGSSFLYRTAVGFSKDQRYVYMITADNSGDSSKGLSIPELQDVMIQAGVWRGMTLDGGGSTQMVARPLGETQAQLVNTPPSQRPVVNGLGVFSTAPKGQVKGIKIEGPDHVFMGETVVMGLKAYDEYYNPVAAADLTPKWISAQGVDQVGSNSFMVKTKGKVTLTAQAGTATATKEMTVIGGDDLVKLKLDTYPSVLREGDSITLSATATMKNGEERKIPANLLQVEIRGFKGTVTGDQLHVDSLEGAKQGALIARYDGYSTMKALSTGVTQTFIDFDGLKAPFSFEGTAGVTGVVNKVSSGDHPDGSFIQLNYDLSKATTGTKAAYVVLGNKDLTVPGAPETMRIQVKGDNSLNWIRAEFVDADGDTNRVDLTKAVNWTGWKTVTADLSALHMTYPAKLTRLYVVSTEQDQDERALTGQIGFDQIQFQYTDAFPQLPRNQVTLQIDKPTIQVNGAAQTIDQAPVVVADNTLVPVRFVAEALGAQVEWSETEQKVTVVRGTQLMEFRIGQKDYLADGNRKTAEVSPEFRNERTMIPLRVLSEHFGWKVDWEESTRTVTLQ